MKRIVTIIIAAAMMVACSKDVVDETTGTSGTDGATANSCCR